MIRCCALCVQWTRIRKIQMMGNILAINQHALNGIASIFFCICWRWNRATSNRSLPNFIAFSRYAVDGTLSFCWIQVINFGQIATKKKNSARIPQLLFYVCMCLLSKKPAYFCTDEQLHAKAKEHSFSRILPFSFTWCCYFSIFSLSKKRFFCNAVQNKSTNYVIQNS